MLLPSLTAMYVMLVSVDESIVLNSYNNGINPDLNSTADSHITFAPNTGTYTNRIVPSTMPFQAKSITPMEVHDIIYRYVFWVPLKYDTKNAFWFPDESACQLILS